jgi:outer membrane scaffolding protein for murein synthesis (MipA/OmpV family)
VMSALSRHWVILGAARVSQLQGDARRSPLTVEPTGYSVSVGLAYRCCR